MEAARAVAWAVAAVVARAVARAVARSVARAVARAVGTVVAMERLVEAVEALLLGRLAHHLGGDLVAPLLDEGHQMSSMMQCI
jgi:hypothetical protein